MNNPYPIILDLANKKIAVVGGGKIAARKINSLLAIKVSPTVISPKLANSIPLEQIHWIQDYYQRKYVMTMDLIIACTNSLQINRQIVQEATAQQLVNDTSEKRFSNFYNMATIMQDDLLIGLSTVGKSPAEVKKIKKMLEKCLNQQN
ncbi:bifunctional precorrin-2 dehydrogenase/sirohydrochlorin ferrochelatase [Lactobacillus mellis]|nr:bifunctional precorrin-2 dehydrogenase/sirohydrochlorin ferrochelatase [Bombilactobacillus mellis]